MTKHKIKTISVELSRSKSKPHKRIQLIEGKIQQLKGIHVDSVEAHLGIQTLSQELNYYYQKQLKATIIRSKAKHVEENDTSSQYFFDLEKRRGKQKLWTKIKTESGKLKHDIDSILEEQCVFYKSLFFFRRY